MDSDILHFSCHGYFDEKDPLSSGIVLKDNVTLTAREILFNQIRSNLVTLSACETGLNKNQEGDELFGFTRSLLYAGAQSIVVSQWSASVRSTLLLMTNFYNNLRSGYDKATALQKSQMETREYLKQKYGKDADHPFFWAPFILIGDMM